jgi:hypothetical protein
MPILVHSTRHGDYFEVSQCPTKRFSLAFQMSNLFEHGNSELLTRVRRSALLGNGPVPMIVSGQFRYDNASNPPRYRLFVSSVKEAG